MTNLSRCEREGFIDFIRNQSKSNSDLAINLAHIITNNSIRCHSVSDAIDTILLHSSNIMSILNRKLITKRTLFQYLHENRVPVTEAVTKQALIDKLIDYWHKNLNNSSSIPPINTSNQKTSFHHQAQNEPEFSSTATDHQRKCTTVTENRSPFPIHEMSRSFAKWFFDNLNTGTIGANDLWSDVLCESNFYENKCIMLNETITSAEMARNFLLTLRNDYQLFLNLNDCDDGVQGRIDPHGLVLVLSCGTLHKNMEFVGTFEAVFGILRDPFAQNNWKIKQIKLRLHNSTVSCAATPTLSECESMQPLLCLEAPTCTVEEIE